MRFILILFLPCLLHAETQEIYDNVRNVEIVFDADAIISLWNKEMPRGERIDLVESTLVAFGGNQRNTLVYFAVCAQEGGFKWVYNSTGCGYSGTKWATLINSAKSHGMKRPLEGWRLHFLTHKRKANFYAALAFADWLQKKNYDYKEVIKIWHRSGRRGVEESAEANKYCRLVMQILGRMVMCD